MKRRTFGTLLVWESRRGGRWRALDREGVPLVVDDVPVTVSRTAGVWLARAPGLGEGRPCDDLATAAGVAARAALATRKVPQGGLRHDARGVSLST